MVSAMLRLKHRVPEMAALFCGAAAMVSFFGLGNWVAAIAACSVGALIIVCL